MGGFECDFCGLVFVKKGSLNHHKETAHAQCEVCGEIFSASILENHKREVHDMLKKLMSSKESEKEENELQDEEEEEEKEEKEEEEEEEEDIKRRFACNYCDYRGKMAVHLERHINAIHWKRRYFCQMRRCGYNASSPGLTNVCQCYGVIRAEPAPGFDHAILVFLSLGNADLSKAFWLSPTSGWRGNRLKEVPIKGWVIDIRQFHQRFSNMGKVLPHGSARTVTIFGAQSGQNLLVVVKPVLAIPRIKDTVVQFGPHRALVPFAP